MVDTRSDVDVHHIVNSQNSTNNASASCHPLPGLDLRASVHQESRSNVLISSERPNETYLNKLTTLFHLINVTHKAIYN